MSETSTQGAESRKWKDIWNKYYPNQRSDPSCWCSAEMMISNVVREIELMGAHPMLTDAIVLLGQARDKIGECLHNSPCGIEAGAAKYERVFGSSGRKDVAPSQPIEAKDDTITSLRARLAECEKERDELQRRNDNQAATIHEHQEACEAAGTDPTIGCAKCIAQLRSDAEVLRKAIEQVLPRHNPHGESYRVLSEALSRHTKK